MNKIKLIYAIFIGLLVMSSCSNNDESDPNPEPEPVVFTSEIIGVWKPMKSVIVFTTGSEDAYELDPCEKRGEIIFSENGSMSISVNEAHTDMCRRIYQANGTWLIINNELSLTIDGETETPGFFELTSNMLRIGDTDFDEGEGCDGDNLPSHYYTEYERAE